MIRKVNPYLFFSIALFSACPAWATTYFLHDAETSSICCSDSSSYMWSNGGVQSLVTRSSDFAKNGNYSLRHEVNLPASTDPQTGKVLKFFAPWTGMPGSQQIAGTGEAYFSNWFYFPSAGNAYAINQGGTGGNWQIWNNHFEWKCDNYQANIECRVGAKLILNMQYYGGRPYWFLQISDFKYVPGPTNTSQTRYPANYFSGTYVHPLDAGNPVPSSFVFTQFEVPFDQWVFLEVYLKIGQTNGAVKIWTGTQTSGLIKLLDISDPNMNTLTMLDRTTATTWSNNSGLYHSAGNYISMLHSAGTYVLYTDDHRISDTQIGPTLPEFSAAVGSSMPLAPTMLGVTVQ